MHPNFFNDQTILNDEVERQIVPTDKPFIVVRGTTNNTIVRLPDSSKAHDGFTVAIHNQMNGPTPSIDVASNSADKIDNENPPYSINMDHPGQLYLFTLDKPAKTWRPLLGYYPGNCN